MLLRSKNKQYVNKRHSEADALRLDGYREILSQIYERANQLKRAEKPLHSGRTVTNMYSHVYKHLWPLLLLALREEQKLMDMLTAILGDSPALTEIQHIVCSPHSPMQMAHRDFLTAGTAATLAVSLCNYPLQTWVIPASHGADFDYVDVSAKTTPGYCGLFQPLLDCMLYDSAIVHCGGSTGEEPDNMRLFLIFVNVSLPTRVLRQNARHQGFSVRSVDRLVSL